MKVSIEGIQTSADDGATIMEVMLEIKIRMMMRMMMRMRMVMMKIKIKMMLMNTKIPSVMEVVLLSKKLMPDIANMAHIWRNIYG